MSRGLRSYQVVWGLRGWLRYMVGINVDDALGNVNHCVETILFGRMARRGSRSVSEINGAGLG